MIAVILTKTAAQQLDEIVEWWQENRTANPMLVSDEFDRCLRLLEASPDAGTHFRRGRVPGIRRLIMRRTKHHLYYKHDEPNAVVYIISLWGAPKFGYPVLFDPREQH